MALVLDDRVKETSTTTSTGALDLSGAVSGFQTFVAGIGDGNTTYYAIVNRDEAEWETGLGTVADLSTDTLTRTTVIASSNSDSAVNFSAGTKDVFATLPASKVSFLDASNDLILGTGAAGVDYSLKFDGETSDGVITWMEDEDSFKVEDDLVMDSTKKLYFNDEGGEYISGDATDLTIASGAKINLTATSDIVVPANVGITFGTGEKIEGDSTDLTITSGAKINLTATSDVVIPANVGITFGTGEKIEGDSTDLTVTSGADINLTATSDVNIPSGVGVTFGNDGEKIEGDGTDLTIAGNNINLTAVADVVIPADVGITFGSGEKIEGNDTDLTVTSGADINLTATADVNIPSGVGVTFGNDGEKIEGDGTDLTIAGNNINLTAVADVVIPANVGITFGSGEKIEGDSTNLTLTSGADIALTATNDVNLPNDVGMVFGDDGEKIEGDGTDLTITSSRYIDFAAGGTTNQVRIQDGALVPIADDDIDLGTSALQFKDAYIDGTLEADAITIGGTAVTAGGATQGFAIAMAVAL
jgi:hypothetical protein